MEKNYKIGILRVLTTDDEEILLSHQKILEEYFTEFRIETRCIPDQYNGIHDEETYNIAFPKIVELAKDWEKSLDGLIISCAGDPALGYLRDVLSIPVVGGGTAATCISLNNGNNIGIIGIEKHPPAIYNEVLGDKIKGYELPDGVITSNDLQTENGKKAVKNSALKLKEIGCDVIVFACTGLSTSGAASYLKDIGLPIVDAVIAEGIMMKFMLIEKSVRGN